VTVIRLVNVESGRESARAETADDGSVTYAGAPFADGTPRPSLGGLEGVVRTVMREEHLGEAQAVQRLAETGWSNGYSMVVAGE